MKRLYAIVFKFNTKSAPFYFHMKHSKHKQAIFVLNKGYIIHSFTIHRKVKTPNLISKMFLISIMISNVLMSDIVTEYLLNGIFYVNVNKMQVCELIEHSDVTQGMKTHQTAGLFVKQRSISTAGSL